MPLCDNANMAVITYDHNRCVSMAAMRFLQCRVKRTLKNKAPPGGVAGPSSKDPRREGATGCKREEENPGDSGDVGVAPDSDNWWFGRSDMRFTHAALVLA